MDKTLDIDHRIFKQRQKLTEFVRNSPECCKSKNLIILAKSFNFCMLTDTVGFISSTNGLVQVELERHPRYTVKETVIKSKQKLPYVLRFYLGPNDRYS